MNKTDVIEEHRKFLVENQEIIASVIENYGFSIIYLEWQTPYVSSCSWVFKVFDLTTQIERCVRADYDFGRKKLYFFFLFKK